MENQDEKTYRLMTDFDKLFVEKKKTQPYHINLIDELRANENAHSRIFIKLISYSENNNFPVFYEFLRALDKPFSNIDIKNPIFTAEKNRVDALIIDNNYAIIIENKIYGAVEQPGQLDNYIETIKNKNIPINQIFVLYLTKSGGGPTVNSLSKDNKEKLENRYREIDYRNFILTWLENNVLPVCRFKDTLLISTLQQYIDYLKGLFHERETDAIMKEDLKTFIYKELNLQNTVDTNNKFNVLSSELSKLDNLSEFIKRIQADLRKELFWEWYDRLRENNDVVTNIFEEKEYLYLGVKVKYKDVEFCCAIGIVDYNSEPYYGITYHGCTKKEKINTIENLIGKSFKSQRYEVSPRWYIYKYSQLDSIFEEYRKFLSEIINQFAFQEKV